MRRLRVSFPVQVALVVTLAVLGVAAGLLYLQERNLREQAFDARVAEVTRGASILEKDIAEEYAKAGREAAVEEMNKEVFEVVEKIGAERVLIASANGTVAADTGAAQERVHPLETAAVKDAIVSGRAVTVAEGDDGMYGIFVPIEVADLGRLAFEAESSLAPLTAVVAEARTQAVVQTLVVLALALPVAGYATARFARQARAKEQRAEEHVRDAEERYRTLVEQIPAITYIDEVDPADPSGFTSMYASPQAEQIHGFTPEQLIAGGSTLWSRMLHPDDRERALAADALHYATGEPLDSEYRVISPDGRIVWLHDLAVMVKDEEGRFRFSHGVQFDITERRLADAQLLETLDLLRTVGDERRRLVSRLVKTQEEERRRIAGDIHDDPIQKMTAVGMRIETLRRHLNDPGQIALIEQLQETVQRSIERLRRLMFELRPPALDREGLATAISQHIEQARPDVGTDHQVENRLSNEPPLETRAIAFRIVQEALANVRKHASAKRVDVLLESRGGGLFVRVQDDGVGIPGAGLGDSRAGHLGLTAMRERAELAGGWWRIRERREHGTMVEFWLPLEQVADSVMPAAG